MTMDGLLLVDKPAGPTSHDVVAAARRATGQSRIGHTGTLDPPATGLLVLLLGVATRLAPFVPHAPKSYEGALCLGLTTTTDDLTGDVLSRSDSRPTSADVIREHAARLVGTSWQVPPRVSAKRVGGQRLYRAARRGTVLEAAPARIEVASFRVEPTDDPDTWRFEATVSSGTFIRALVRDLGASLGCGATLATLRRTRIGPFDVTRAIDGRLSRNVVEAHLVPIDEVPLEAGAVFVTDEESEAFRHGRKIGLQGIPDGIVAVRSGLGRLLGVGAVTSSTLVPRTVLHRPGTVDGARGAVVSSTRSTS